MTTENWDAQASLKIGDWLINVRTNGNDDGLIARAAALETSFRDLKAVSAQQAPQQPVQGWQQAPGAQPQQQGGWGQQPTHQQAVQNVQNQMGGQVVQEVQVPAGQPPNGAIYPGKLCFCGAPRIVAAGISRKTNKPYYRLDCQAQPKAHDADWGMNPR